MWRTVKVAAEEKREKPQDMLLQTGLDLELSKYKSRSYLVELHTCTQVSYLRPRQMTCRFLAPAFST